MELSLDLSPLKKCVQSLRSALQVFQNKPWFDSQTKEVQELLISGVVKNFEFVYEVSVKFIKLSLEVTALDPSSYDQLDFREILRLALESGLIDFVEQWFDFRKLRNVTAHTYSQDKAEIVAGQSQALLKSVEFLLTELQKRHE